MKKNVGKKFRLMALLASLTLVLWGGVIACSNGSDDTGNDGKDETEETGKEDDAQKTKTISFDDDEKVVLEASEISENVVSIKITVTGVTGTADNWWFWANTDGNKGDDIKWKSGSEAEAIYEVTITDTAKIQYLKKNGLAIKGAKGLTAKVTVDVTETKPDATTPDKDDSEEETKAPGDESTPPGDDGSDGEDGDGEADDNDDDGNGDEAKEFYYFYKADQIQENVASLKITVTNVTSTTSEDWWFWANTDGDKGDSIAWKSGEGTQSIYEVTIADSTKIAYLKEKGIEIKGAKGLSATVTVTTAENDTGDGDETGDDEPEAKEFYHFMEAEKILETANSITITVTDVTSTTSEDWWFWANTDGNKGDDIKWDSKTEDGKDVYKLTITDATKIAYIKEKGLEIKGAKGLTATVKISCEV